MDIKQAIELVGVGFEGAGVLALLIGTLWAFTGYVSRLLRPGKPSTAYQALRRDLGKAILIGLELLVAADIVRSVALEATFARVGVLGLIVLVRTFLSWSTSSRDQWELALATCPLVDACSDRDGRTLNAILL